MPSIYTPHYLHKMIKILIADDEVNVREALTTMVERYTSGFEVIGAVKNLSDASTAIATLRPDILLLDIELGKDNAFDIYKYFPEPFFKIIFVTSYQQYAVQAFRFAATDYLLKPVDPDLLIEALQRAGNAIDKNRLADKIDNLLHSLPQPASKPRKIVLKTSDNIHVVNPDDITYCEASRSYTIFHMVDNSKITVSVTLGEYEELLKTHDFLRIHHSYLLNINYMKRFSKADGGQIVLKDNTVLPVASRKKERVLEMLKQPWI